MLQSQNLRMDRYEYFFLLIILIGFIFITITYSIVTPAFEGPDEEFHFKTIEEYSEGTFSEKRYLRENPLSLVIYSAFLNLYDYEKTDIPDNWPIRIVKESQVHNRFLHFEEENFPFFGTASAVHYLRALSIVVGIIVLLFTYKIAGFFFSSNYLRLMPVALVAFIPKFAFTFSVINTEVFLILFATITFYFLLKFIKTTSQKYLILTSIFSGLCLLTKINGLLVILIVLIVFLILAISKRVEKKHSIKNSLEFILIAIVTGGWFQFFKIWQTLDLDQFASDPVHFLGPRTRPEAVFLDIKHRFFETIWSNLGWGDVSAPSGFFEFISLIILISIIGIVFFFTKKIPKEKKQFENFDKIQFFALLTIIFVFLSGLMYMIMTYNAANGRNVLAIIPFVGILWTLGLSSFVNKRKKQFILIIPVFILFFYCLFHIPAMEEELRYDFGNKFPYNYIISGHGTNDMGSAFTSIQHGFLEGGQEGIYLFLHPNNGQTWWNFTMPIDEKIDTLKYYYGFAVSPVRSLPVEFSVYVNGEKVFSDKKYYTCTLSYFEKNLEKYKGDNVEIALATDGLVDNYAAWAIWKPVLDEKELFLIKPTHPKITKTWFTKEYGYDLHPCELQDNQLKK